jgi:hypothetical protein
MDLSRPIDAPPSLLSTGLILSTGLVLVLLSLYLKRFQSGPGRLLGRLVLAVTVSWYVVFGLSFLYPHQHHRIWSAALSYRSNYWINAGLGALWLAGSHALWRRQKMDGSP